MNEPCSVAVLKSALAGSLPAGEERALQLHLEVCQDCAATLERLAGGTSWCEEAAGHLKSDDLDEALPPHHGWSAIDFTVEHLEPADEPNVLGRLGGHDVLEILGHGSMSVVLKAFDRHLHRNVAVKVLAPHLAHSSLARKRFIREARAAAAVVHPHVLAIHQVQTAGRLPFLVMPLVAGESLAERLAARGALELEETLRIGMQVAAGLAAAHEQGLIHRDVKPGNILLEKGVERAVLTDFGLARAADDLTLTRWGIVAGTPQYMSPEQARGEPLDCRSDLFSLGCVLYEMATGVSPFRADSTLATLRRLVDEPAPALGSLDPELPPWFVALVQRLLEKDPSRRFSSAQEVSELLEQCLAHVQQPAVASLPEQLVAGASCARKKSRNSLRGVLAGVLFAFVLLAAGVVLVLELGRGTLTIETDVDDVAVRVTQGGAVVEKLTVTRAGKNLRVAAGTYTVEIVGDADGLTVENDTVTVRRGDAEIVRIKRSDEAKNVPETDLLPSGPPPSFPPMPAPGDLSGAVPTGKPTVPSPFPATASPQVVRQIEVQDPVQFVAWSPDGRRIAIANGNPTFILQTNGVSRVKDDWRPVVEILDAQEGKKLLSLDLSTDDEDAVVAATERVSHFEVTALAYSPDGKTLAVGTSIGHVKLFDAQTGQLVRALDDEEKRADKETPEAWAALPRAMGSVASLAFSPDGASLAVCGKSFGDFSDVFDGVESLGRAVTGSGRLKTWDVNSGKYVRDLPGHSHANAVAFAFDGGVLASAGSWEDAAGHGTGLIVWNLATRRILLTAQISANGGARAVAVSPDGKLAAVGAQHFDKDKLTDASTGEIRLLHVASGITEWQQVVPVSAQPLAFAPNGKTLLALCGRDSIRLIDVETGRTKDEIRAADGVRWNHFAVSPQGRMLAIGGANADGHGRIEFWVWEDAGDRAPAPDAAPPRTPGISEQGAIQGFSEVKEVLLSMDSMHFMLDLDSGRTMDPPATIGRPEQALMDLHATQWQPYELPQSLTGLLLQGRRVKPSDWNATAEELRDALARGRLQALKQIDYDPAETATYLFQTHDGAKGILQVLGQEHQPKGIRVRYKRFPSKGP